MVCLLVVVLIAAFVRTHGGRGGEYAPGTETSSSAGDSWHGSRFTYTSSLESRRSDPYARQPSAWVEGLGLQGEVWATPNLPQTNLAAARSSEGSATADRIDYL